MCRDRAGSSGLESVQDWAVTAGRREGTSVGHESGTGSAECELVTAVECALVNFMACTLCLEAVKTERGEERERERNPSRTPALPASAGRIRCPRASQSSPLPLASSQAQPAPHPCPPMTNLLLPSPPQCPWVVRPSTLIWNSHLSSAASTELQWPPAGPLAHLRAPLLPAPPGPYPSPPGFAFGSG